MTEEKILIVGGGGQLGTVLRKALNKKFHSDNVMVSDIKDLHPQSNPFVKLNVTNYDHVLTLFKHHKFTQIYHLAAILSARGEADPAGTREVNSTGYFNVLCASVACGVRQVFYPSSIAVYGPDARKKASQEILCHPTTVYGVTKLNCENWSNYFHYRYGLDIRSLRYPGVIGYQSMPGGGTTDYAVTIFHSALKGEKFHCFLKEDEKLPMIYMDDAIRATIKLMDADPSQIRTRTSYNISGLSFTPGELAAEIKKYIPSFEIEYHPDERQIIAESWPDSIIDTEAAEDWNWKAEYNLSSLVEDMIINLSPQYK